MRVNVRPEELNNPLRCIHCNLILSTKGKLTQHHKICKVKNNKVQPTITTQEQKIRALTEQADLDRKKHAEELEANRKMYDEKQEAQNAVIEALRKQVEQLLTRQPVETAPVVNIDNSVHIVVNNYHQPDTTLIVGRSATLEDFYNAKCAYTDYFVKRLWIDPEKPQNHSILPIDAKSKSMEIVQDGQRVGISGSETVNFLHRVSNVVADVGRTFYERLRPDPYFIFPAPPAVPTLHDIMLDKLESNFMVFKKEIGNTDIYGDAFFNMSEDERKMIAETMQHVPKKRDDVQVPSFTCEICGTHLSTKQILARHQKKCVSAHNANR
jgi:hypothetical protein